MPLSLLRGTIFAGPTLLAMIGIKKTSTRTTHAATEKLLTGSTVTRSNSSVGHNGEVGQRRVMRGIGINVSPVVGPVTRI